MFENIANFFRKLMKSEKKEPGSKDAAKERLHLVLMQDRANVSADFLELMKQEIIDVIKKYIEVDEKEIDVRLTNKENEDGTNGAPALYANIPILNIKNEMKKEVMSEKKEEKTEFTNEAKEVVAEQNEDVTSVEENSQPENKEIDVDENITCSQEKAEENVDVDVDENIDNLEKTEENVDVDENIDNSKVTEENEDVEANISHSEKISNV